MKRNHLLWHNETIGGFAICRENINEYNNTKKPNQKWVTDISYIETKQGTPYLSVIRDLYDNSIIAFKTGTEQNINLVLITIRAAKKKRKGHHRAATPQ